MEITKLDIYRREKEGSRLKAFVDFTLDDCLAIRGAKIIDGKTRVFVSMPGKLNKEGKEENVVFPINKEMRDYLETTILDAYNKMLEEEE
jgi:stage V sporulation protein G